MNNSYASWPPNVSKLCYKGNVTKLFSYLLSSILVKTGGKKTSAVLIRIDILERTKTCNTWIKLKNKKGISQYSYLV